MPDVEDEDTAAIRNLCSRADLGFPAESTVRKCLLQVRKVKGDIPEVVRMIRRQQQSSKKLHAGHIETVPAGAGAAMPEGTPPRQQQ
eukprot:COSAG05_NODE_11164_length_527_cov_0.880841_1_plen_86_part_10